MRRIVSQTHMSLDGLIEIPYAFPVAGPATYTGAIWRVSAARVRTPIPVRASTEPTP